MKRDRSEAHDQADDSLPARARKGRGAVTNRAGRFEPTNTEAVDDGWARPEDEDLPPLRTTVIVDSTRSIIARNQSPDVGFDRSINPYRGCEHGCVYCFARPTHAFLGMSPGVDFESRLFAKPNAAALLAKELSASGYVPKVIAMGTNTDPYQPLERTRRITRQVLEVLSDCNHPVGIVTKSALVTRDIDILAPMAAKRLARVALSVTTLDRDLARTLEPRASTPAKRLGAIRALADAGIPASVMVAPIIPALTDAEMESILEAALAAGATGAGYGLLRLPLEIKDLFTEWLDAHAPDKAKRVLDLVRSVRDGRLNDPSFGRRMRGQGPYAELINQRFHLATKRLGLGQRDRRFDLSLFKRPAKPIVMPRADDRQMTLLF
jgi:DNA repair photolyase